MNTDLPISKPVLIGLIGAILVGAFIMLKPFSSEQAVAPAPVTPNPTATAATGATGPAKTEKPKRTKAQIRRARERKIREAAAKAGLPVEIYKAKLKGKIVLIYFWEKRGVDDQEVYKVVKQVDAEREKVVVFVDSVANSERYSGISEAAKLSSTPAIVLLYRSRASVWEGLITPVVLRQRIREIVHNFKDLQ